MPPPPRLQGGGWAAPGTGGTGTGKAAALGLAGLGHGASRWPSVGGEEPGSARCQPQATLPIARGASAATRSQAAAAEPSRAVLCQQLGGTGCTSGWQRASSHSHVQPGTVELLPSPWPLALPKPDAGVTLAVPSPASPILGWHVACRCLQAPRSAPGRREMGPGQLPPASLPPGALLAFGSHSRGPPAPLRLPSLPEAT